MRARASLTVFLALIIGMMLAVVFGFLEAARVSGLRANAQMQAAQAADCLLSEYHADLWKDYDILLWEAPEGNADRAAARQMHHLAHNQEGASVPGRREYPFVEITPAAIVVDTCEYATDHGGKPFRDQAVVSAKKGLAQKAVDELTEAFRQGQDSGVSEEMIQNLEQAAERVEKQLEDAEAEAPGSGTPEPAEAEDPSAAEDQAAEAQDPASLVQKQKLKKDNPIKWMRRIRKEGVLALVMPGKEPSGKTLDGADLLSSGDRTEGNGKGETGGGAADRIWYQLYLQQRFCDASRESNGGALDYELEYLIAGKAGDTDNLKAAVNRLLLLREGANYVYLLHDKEKCEEALILATAIASAFGQPELAEPVKHAVLLAWAYAESVCDVRTLLAGGRIAPVKTKEQWKTELDHLSGEYRGEASDTGDDAKNGWNYTQYLQMILMTQKLEKITFRAMDLIEQREGIRMDHMVSGMECSYLFEAQPLFWRYVTLGEQSVGGFSWQITRQFSYLPGQS